MANPASAPTPVHPLQAVIDDLKKIIAVQTANPKDPALPQMVDDVEVKFEDAMSNIIGEDDDRRGKT